MQDLLGLGSFRSRRAVIGAVIGLKIDQAKRLKELERENERLKKAVSELTLDKLKQKEALTGKY